MKRRTFLKTMGAMVGTLATSPVKGIEAIAKQGIVPAFKHVQGGNQLLSPGLISRAILAQHKYNLAMSEMIKKIPTSKKGGTIKTRRPPSL